MQSRLAAWKELPPQRERATRGYARLFEDCVLQADEGCDFDFLLREGENRLLRKRCYADAKEA
jgi:dihydroxy-acid dehydratase